MQELQLLLQTKNDEILKLELNLKENQSKENIEKSAASPIASPFKEINRVENVAPKEVVKKVDVVKDRVLPSHLKGRSSRLKSQPKNEDCKQQ